MENQRLILFFALAAVLFLLYESWMQDYHSTTAPQVQINKQPAQDEIPTATMTSNSSNVQNSSDTLINTDKTVNSFIQVDTDLLRVAISTRGGILSNAWLLNYAITPEHPEEKLQLLKAESPNLFIVQSGLISKEHLLPTHESIFQSSNFQYQLGAKDDQVAVDLTWQNEAGIEVDKRYLFKRGSYVIETSQTINNKSTAPLTAREYNQIQRTEYHDANESNFVRTYTGGVFYSPQDKYKKLSFDEMKKGKLEQGKNEQPITDGWLAMMQHYFIAAWIPPRTVQQIFYTKVLDQTRFIIGKYSPIIVIDPGTTYTFNNQLFIGPKLQNTLTQVAPGLDLAIDYSWLTVIAKPIFWIMSQIHSVIGNWGWAIIFLTILIKLAFYKLSEASYKSMANMRQFAPRLQALKERYGDDTKRLNQAMMELYQTEKINPLGGCLPILIQIPVFIALYWVLLESVEMRQAPFMLWLNNLSAPDPYFVLPLIMGVSMYVQQTLNPAPPDPMQAKIMMALPFVFTVFFAFFPAGLVLYWTVNNLLSIAQQWYITNAIEQAAALKHKKFNK